MIDLVLNYSMIFKRKPTSGGLATHHFVLQQENMITKQKHGMAFQMKS